MTAEDLASSIEKAGGVLKLEGEQVRCWLPTVVAHLAPELKERKSDLIEVLRRAGGRIATFPHCPRCASYALFRTNDNGDYECMTCGQDEIKEHIARRVQ